MNARHERPKRHRLYILPKDRPWYQWLGLLVCVPGAAVVIKYLNVPQLLHLTGRDRPAAAATKDAGHALPPKLTAVSASKTDPPVLIESVSDLVDDEPDGTMALSQPLDMTPVQLSDFNRQYQSSGGYESLKQAKRAWTLNNAYTTLGVRDNWGEQVSISRIEVKKTCGPPASGTYFVGDSEGGGGGGPVVRVGFNLDSPEPDALEMGMTQARGLTPTGNKYFPVSGNIELEPQQQRSLSVDVFTTTHACTFRFMLYVATSKGIFTETVDNHGHPFRITAIAHAKDGRYPLSGYGDAYALKANANGNTYFRWYRVDPARFTKE